jgi:hypothetical protein
MSSMRYTPEFRAEAIRLPGAGFVVPGVACI